jgi:hypothetical protein
MGGGGGGKGGGGGGGSGGASDLDMMLINKATQENIQALQNRYKQLGLGQPSGDPLQAALGKQSLTYAGPSTMEAQDVQAQKDIGQAAIGQVQAQNINNPFAPGSPANLTFLASQNLEAATAAGKAAGLQSGGAGGPGTGPGLDLSSGTGTGPLGNPPANFQDVGTPGGVLASHIG